MRFDAAPRERLVSSRTPRAPSPEVVEVDDPGVPYRERRKQHALRWWQILIVLVAIFAVAYCKTVYYPEHERARQAEREAIERENEERLRAYDAQRGELDRRMIELVATYPPGVLVGCAALQARIAEASACILAPGNEALMQTALRLLRSVAAAGSATPASSKTCDASVVRLDAELRRHGCEGARP